MSGKVARAIGAAALTGICMSAAARPTVLLDAESLVRLRADTRPNAPKAEQYTTSVLANAHRWLNRPITIPPRSGHYHDFVCVDGTRFPEPPDQTITITTPDTTIYKCPACGREYSGEKYDAALRQRYHTWLMTAARDLALCGAVENDASMKRKAAQILLKYADAYPGRHTAHAGPAAGGIFWQSLDEAVNMIPLAQAYDLIADENVLTRDERQHIEQHLFRESAEGLMAMGIGSNWGSWHLSAVGVIGYAIRDQRLIDFALKSFRSQISDQLGSDGIWPESIHYHFYPMRGFLHLAEAARGSGTDLYNWEAPGQTGQSLRAMFTAPLSYMYPDFDLPAINDGWFGVMLPLDIYELGYSRYHSAEIGWAVQELRRIAAEQPERKSNVPDENPLWILLHSENILQPLNCPEFASRDFGHIGIAALRASRTKNATDELFLTFDYGPYLGHGQHDKMGITLFAQGRLLAADYGTPSYGAATLPYYTGTLSHNTMMVDGQNQNKSKFGILKSFSSSPELSIACAETTEAYAAVRWTRSIAVTPDYALIVDDLESENVHEYQWLFHCEGERLLITPEPKLADAQTTFGFPFLKKVREAGRITPETKLRWADSSEMLVELQQRSPTGTTMMLAEFPAETAARHVHGVVLQSRGKSARFAVLLTTSRSTWELKSDAARYEITGPAPREFSLSADGELSPTR